MIEIDLYQETVRLQETVRQMLSETKTPARVIADEAGVGYEWLNKFKQRKINEPSVKKVQDVYLYLKKWHKPDSFWVGLFNDNDFRRES